MSSNSNSSPQATLVTTGSVVYTEGKPTKFLYIIKKGEVRLMKLVNNHLHVLHICSAGEIIGDISVLTNKNVDHTAVALHDVELMLIDANDIRSVINKCPKWVNEIFKTLCERLVDSQEIIDSHNLLMCSLEKNYIITKEEDKILKQRIAEFNS
jgi:CRP-like cAMP-binding protein